MDAKSLQIMGLTFYGMGFPSQGKEGEQPRTLYAVFYYLHHGGFVEDVNSTLAAKGLRPMSRKEMAEFFAAHQLSLSGLDHPFFVATAPEDMLPDSGNGKQTLLPGIWKHEGILKHGKGFFFALSEAGNVHIQTLRDVIISLFPYD